MLLKKNILLGITGSIAAYKSAFLARLLVKSGAQVQAVLTHSAQDFITPLTLSTLTKRPVYSQFVMNEMGEWTNHVELGLWADLMIIAPASSNTISKCVNGACDDLLSATYLSAKCPVVFAPAMDLDMWQHPATKKNIKTLESYGNKIIYPASGELASGLVGEGRMEEPEAIVQYLNIFFQDQHRFQNKKVLITAGPTFEAIDPVRFIGNRSSGKMGFAIAQTLADQGAEVILVAGPVSLETPSGHVHRIDVETADEMKAAVENAYTDCDVLILSAAVADFKPETTSNSKIKKSEGLNQINLKETDDILKWLGENKKENQLLVGFALETNDVENNALKKLRSKNVDLLVVNQYNEQNSVFGNDNNQISLLFKNGEWKHFESMTKTKVSLQLAEVVYQLLLA